jgi:ATP-binding cassette subfamily B protein
MWGLLGTASYYACYAWVVLRTLSKEIGLGSMTLYLSIFRQSQGAFTGIFEGLNALHENGLFMENLFSFLDLPEAQASPPASSLPPLDPQRGLEIDSLSFRYTDASPWALRDVSLRIGPGEKIALVGENGSGKTTLIKLLTRLYEPTEGTISYQGRNLRDWSHAQLREKIGVIFQDFVRYQLTLRENVGFGSIESLQDQKRLDVAASQGGLDSLVSALDEGWETTLGGRFGKGRELSGGQWQKVALSRAFMRDGEIIVLDEPTSALDAEREYEIFQKFKELTAGKIAFLISHRFSTVRMADRIVVLNDGHIIESGSHAELLASHGTYARLFDMQAKGYR